MTALKMEELEKLEEKHGLSPDGLSYQHRCSRITAYEKGNGNEWKPPEKKERQEQGPQVNGWADGNSPSQPSNSRFANHPLYGKRLLITPMMVPDAKRNLAFDEPLGPEITVRDYNAGEQIYGADKDIDRMVGDYEVISVDRSKQVIAKTTFPKVGTEISWELGKELVPVVRGNDGKKGYIWSYPTSMIFVDDGGDGSYIQVYGLKTLIRQVYPELEEKFSGKPMMDYVDGVTLVASIPQTHALLKSHRRREMMAAAAGFDDGYGIY